MGKACHEQRSKRLVLIHNILPPYRIPLFNSLHDLCDGEFGVVLTRDTHAQRRQWTLSWESVRFDWRILKTIGIERGERALDLSLGVSRALNSWQPQVVVVAGWDLHACWSAVLWCQSRGVPVYAWVESSQMSGVARGAVSNAVRRIFLAGVAGAIVAGCEAEAFVRELRPGVRTVRIPNPVDSPELRMLPLPTSKQGLLYIGELSERKGFDVILGCLGELVRMYGRVYVAGVGPLQDQLYNAVRVTSGVEYLGYLEGDARRDAFEAAQVLLVPSRRDPWPLVACEALVAGRSVVVGPGVSSKADLIEVAGQAVCVMHDMSTSALLEAASQARERVVPDAARQRFTPTECAEGFISLTRWH